LSKYRLSSKPDQLKGLYSLDGQFLASYTAYIVQTSSFILDIQYNGARPSMLTSYISFSSDLSWLTRGVLQHQEYRDCASPFNWKIGRLQLKLV